MRNVTGFCFVPESSLQLHITRVFYLVHFKILQQFQNHTKLIPHFLQFSFQNSFSKSDTAWKYIAQKALYITVSVMIVGN